MSATDDQQATTQVTDATSRIARRLGLELMAKLEGWNAYFARRMADEVAEGSAHLSENYPGEREGLRRLVEASVKNGALEAYSSLLDVPGGVLTLQALPNPPS